MVARSIFIGLLGAVGCLAVPILNAGSKSEPAGKTVLGIENTHFTINGKPAFLLGLSYYGALGAREDFIRKDLADMQRHGFNWLRVWATWGAFDQASSAVDSEGAPNQPELAKLGWLIGECDRRGLIVDVTLTRGKASPSRPSGQVVSLAAHRRAVEVLIGALRPHRNWYLDLANEHDIRDDRCVPNAQLRELRERVRALDPQRRVTASFGGHDLSSDDVREAMQMGFDFLAPHRPRVAGSPAETEAKTRACLATMKELGHMLPVHYQEPFRRGYADWEPAAADFLADLGGAVAGGAAGWCLHNGSQRGAPAQQPRRSFDLRSRRLFEQLDPEELKAVARVPACITRK